MKTILCILFMLPVLSFASNNTIKDYDPSIWINEKLVIKLILDQEETWYTTAGDDGKECPTEFKGFELMDFKSSTEFLVSFVSEQDPTVHGCGLKFYCHAKVSLQGKWVAQVKCESLW